MPENRLYPPEGSCPPSSKSLTELEKAMETGEILQGTAYRCDAQQTLHVHLGNYHGQIPYADAIAPWINGASRNISVLSRVGKQICFTVKQIHYDAKGDPVIQLSRRDAQEKAMTYFLDHLHPGSVLSCRVIRMESFGAFLDIGCGIVAMLPLERISISRISHPKERFQEGQRILAVISQIDREQRRITMTHRELLGTWMENASLFAPGETVEGIVRSVKDYGVFVELTPNLSGLTDPKEGVAPGDLVSVYIKSIRPERMKIKLQIIEKLSSPQELPPLPYQITDGTLERWLYSPPNYEKEAVETDFKASYS